MTDDNRPRLSTPWREFVRWLVRREIEDAIRDAVERRDACVIDESPPPGPTSPPKA